MDTRSAVVAAVTGAGGSGAGVAIGAGVAATGVVGVGVCEGVSLNTLLTGSDVALACRKDFGSAVGSGSTCLGVSLPGAPPSLACAPDSAIAPWRGGAMAMTGAAAAEGCCAGWTALIGVPRGASAVCRKTGGVNTTCGAISGCGGVSASGSANGGAASTGCASRFGVRSASRSANASPVLGSGGTVSGGGAGGFIFGVGVSMGAGSTATVWLAAPSVLEPASTPADGNPRLATGGGGGVGCTTATVIGGLGISFFPASPCFGSFVPLRPFRSWMASCSWPLNADSPAACELAGAELDFIGCGKEAREATGIETAFTSAGNALPQPMLETRCFSAVAIRSDTKFWRLQRQVTKSGQNKLKHVPQGKGKRPWLRNCTRQHG
jgi:hypothetical protein